MSNLEKSGTYALGHRKVKRLGYGAMQLAGPGVFGPPRDRDAALAVLREAVARGVRKELGRLVHWTYTYHVQGYHLPRSLNLI